MYKAVSIAEPYPAFIRMRVKHFETRAYRTSYRGKLLICATRKVWDMPEYFQGQDIEVKPGMAYLVADLTDCIEITPEFIKSLDPAEIAAGFYSVGRFAWKLENVREIEPREMRGYPWMWNIEEDI